MHRFACNLTFGRPTIGLRAVRNPCLMNKALNQKFGRSDNENLNICFNFQTAVSFVISVFQVIESVFEYLMMLRTVGPQEWFYKELQTVEETSFRWKEQVDKYTPNLQLFHGTVVTIYKSKHCS